MKDYEKLVHKIKVKNEDESKVAYHVTHYGIYHQEKNSTKFRVVFNCSSVNDNRILLKDIQKNGKVIQENLHALMLIFRAYTHALITDIKIM